MIQSILEYTCPVHVAQFTHENPNGQAGVNPKKGYADTPSRTIVRTVPEHPRHSYAPTTTGRIEQNVLYTHDEPYPVLALPAPQEENYGAITTEAQDLPEGAMQDGVAQELLHPIQPVSLAVDLSRPPLVL